MAVIGGTKVTSCKQAAKLMKQSPEKFTVRIERLTNVKSQEQEIKFEEDNISIKVFFHLPNFVSQDGFPKADGDLYCQLFCNSLIICLLSRSLVSKFTVPTWDVALHFILSPILVQSLF